jgi:L-2-hydroxyglutarate oxidase LhgO
MFDYETTVIGAGVIGLAIARELAVAAQNVLILEQHPLFGSEISARNSEVIHAGIYYPKASLKAQFCVRGKSLLYQFCNDHSIAHNKIGKIIVATTTSQADTLLDISRKAIDNGVDDLRALSEKDLHSLEPQLAGVAGLYSPSTGIIDSHAYMQALLTDALKHGAELVLRTKVRDAIRISGGGFKVEIEDQDGFTFTTKNLIIAAGLQATSLVKKCAPQIPVPETHYAKGNYFRLNTKAPFSHLIYPVPESAGLGVHLTLDMAGQARFGPDVEWVKSVDYKVDPIRGNKFYAAIRNYWPDLPDNSLEADYAGIRPKLATQHEPASDFQIMTPSNHGIDGLIALLGIESPGLTSSLAIAEYVKNQLIF